ncbi:MAG: Gfo/Idh/MocA family protein [Candidatus Methylomirabilales bacterium]
MTDLRVAIVGNGGIYKLAHGPAWRQIPGARVVATCDIVKERAEQACRELEAAAAFTRIEDLLEMDGIDLVDICTPSDTHAKLAVQVLRAGKHAICEKPMALTPGDAARMIEAAEDAKRHLYIGHTRRFDRRWVQMKEQIMGGRIGEPVAVRRTERCWGAFPKEDWHWDLARSGGVLMDLGIHVADLFSWFLDAEPTEVYAKALMVREEAQEQGCFDFGIIQVGFPRGKRGIMEVSWAHPKEYAPLYSTTEIIGTRGKLTLTDKDAAPMTVVKREIGIPRYSPLLSSFPETFVDELSHFLDCILQNTPPRITLAQASTAVKVIATAFESIASGRPISLPGEFQDAESRHRWL